MTRMEAYRLKYGDKVHMDGWNYKVESVESDGVRMTCETGSRRVWSFKQLELNKARKQ